MADADTARSDMHGASASDSDAMDDETWALELEEEFLMEGKAAAVAQDAQERCDAGESAVTQHPASCSCKSSSIANDLPQEVLIAILEFTTVGRVSKAWSLAAITLGRRKCCAKLAETLVPFHADADGFAQGIEIALFDAYGQRFVLPRAYNQRARQLVFNLKDPRNETLRDRLFSSELSLPSFVRMTARDMANPQLVRQRQQWIKKRTHEVMRETRDMDGVTPSDMFECRQCGSRHTCYRQWRRKAIVDRTRIIVICLDCPHRWEL